MLTESEVLAHCSIELQGSSLTSELAEERADSMRYYLGEPYGDETEQRSQIVTREVLEGVEWITPSLMRIFMDDENACSFEAVGPEDEDAAEQESDVVNHVFWNQNNGFYNMITAIKDGLLSKTGWLKIWWDKTEHEEREEYSGIDEVTVFTLLSDEEFEREVIDSSVNEDGTIDVSFNARKKRGKVTIAPCAPEDVGVNRDAFSPLVEDCRFVYHQERKTRSQLREMGFDQELIDKIPAGEDALSEERLARRHLDDERDLANYASDPAGQTVWITECYIRLDRDEDGIAEPLKVVMGGAVSVGSGGGSNVVLAVEDIDEYPLFAWTPVLLTHKFTGLSVADLQRDIQYTKSTLLRSMFDNIYHMNNVEKAVNDRANVEDLLTTMPGGIKRVSGNAPVGDAIMPISVQPLPQQAFGLLEVLDDMTKGRTGVGAETAALDASSLANVNTGVAAIAYDASRARIEMIARMCAEFLLAPAFKRIHELLSKNVQGRLAVKLKGEWVKVHPSEWRKRENVTVNVGVGQASKERKIIALEQIMAKQIEAVQIGGLGQVLTTENLYNMAHDYSKLLGAEPSRYWTDPQMIPPPEPPPESPQEMALKLQAEIEKAKLELDGRKQQAAEKKLQLEAEARIVSQSIEQRKLQSNVDIATIKAEMGLQKQAIDEQSQIMNAQATLASKEADVVLRGKELELKEFIEKQKLLLGARAQEIDQYKAELMSLTKLMGDMKGELETFSKRTEALDQVRGSENQELRGVISSKLEELIEQLGEPVTAETDDQGNIIKIGGTVIEYGE